MLHSRKKEAPTTGDYIAIAMNPLFIGCLVGSLVFFLLDVFYQGGMEGGIRWMMFWYVVAIVAVARISVERGAVISNVYGLSLAVTTWLYLSSTHEGFMLGIFLLAFVWWCAHCLVKDCARSEDQDAGKPSGQPAQGILDQPSSATTSKSGKKEAASKKQAGLWVVYFSLAAVPLFGIGNVLLPEAEGSLRDRVGWWFGLYLSSALILLISTRFLNLRQSLRQRRKQMPAHMSLQWYASGLGIMFIVGLTAWLIPRPGATQQWKYVSQTVNTRLSEASDWAMQWNPAGEGEGLEKNLADRLGDQLAESMVGDEGESAQRQAQDPGEEGTPGDNGADGRETSQESMTTTNATGNGWLQTLFWLVVCCLVAAWIYRHRALLASLFRDWWEAIRLWLRRRQTRGKRSRQSGGGRHPASPPKSFKAFRNPFSNPKAQQWKDDQWIVYSMEAFEAWLRDQRIPASPSDTPQDQLQRWSQTFPDIAEDLQFLYTHHLHAGFGGRVRPDFDRASLQTLWDWMQHGTLRA